MLGDDDLGAAVVQLGDDVVAVEGLVGDQCPEVDAVLYCARIGTHQLIDINVQIGTRLPLHNTAAGKALIAFSPPDERARLLDRLAADEAAAAAAPRIRAELETIWSRGFAINDTELAPSVRAVAAPLWKRGNSLVGAINLACPAESMSLDDLVETIAPQLLEAAHAISLSLGAAPHWVESPDCR